MMVFIYSDVYDCVHMKNTSKACAQVTMADIVSFHFISVKISCSNLPSDLTCMESNGS